jgi:hypothetical protein
MREKRLVGWTLVMLLILPSLLLPQPVRQRAYLDPNFIAPESTALDSFRKYLQDFSAETETLQRKARITREEKERTAVLAKEVKDSIPLAKQHFESVIEKIKSDGKWTPELDTYMVEQVSRMEMPSETKDAFINQVKRNGGARAVLEKALQVLPDAGKDIDDTRNAIERKQSASWLFGIAYANPRWAL